jgi:hypothetical protein
MNMQRRRQQRRHVLGANTGQNDALTAEQIRAQLEIERKGRTLAQQSNYSAHLATVAGDDPAECKQQ